MVAVGSRVGPRTRVVEVRQGPRSTIASLKCVKVPLCQACPRHALVCLGNSPRIGIVCTFTAFTKRKEAY